MVRIEVTYIDTDPASDIFRGAIVVEVPASLDHDGQYGQAKQLAAGRIPASATITEYLWLK